jgi:drug/metabolite transporter (DMT)-like permease
LVIQPSAAILDQSELVSRFFGRYGIKSISKASSLSLKNSSHLAAVFQALLVTFLWSTSWVLIKVGLEDIPAITFAGLRYCLACLCLLPFVLKSDRRRELRNFTGRQWSWLVVLGILFYAVTQGAQFLGLAYLPAMTTSLLLNFTTSMVAIIGIFWLAEVPGVRQWFGILLALAGSFIFFNQSVFLGDQLLGMGIVGVGVVANAISSVLGRQINREAGISPWLVTAISMGIGGLILLAAGLLSQGLPRLGLASWAIIIWLAVINTAFAFTLWNHTLRTLSAVESSIINNTMMIQIAILAWVFLGEGLTPQKLAGMGLAAAGTLIVQLRRKAPFAVRSKYMPEREIKRP